VLVQFTEYPRCDNVESNNPVKSAKLDQGSANSTKATEPGCTSQATAASDRNARTAALDPNAGNISLTRQSRKDVEIVFFLLGARIVLLLLLWLLPLTLLPLLLFSTLLPIGATPTP
jgi:Flp pilus assembly protein TadB